MTESWFKEQAHQNHQLSRKLHRKHQEISLWRILSFIVFLVMFILSVQIRSMYLLVGVAAAFLLVFGALVKFHNKIKARQKYHRLLKELNDNEIERLQMRLQQFPGRKSYMHKSHAYSQDLDLFGQHSLFQWLNRTVTPRGRDRLAHEMCHQVDPGEIADRQTAVKELREKPHWLQAFMAGGLAHQDDNCDMDPLLEWVARTADPPVPLWHKMTLAVMPLITLITLIGFLYGFLHFYYLLGVLVINGLLLRAAYKPTSETYEQTHRSIRILQAYGAMIADIEHVRFTAPLLQKLQEPFRDKSYLASAAIGELRNILSRIETRQNLLYWIFNMIFLLDLIWLIQAAHWKLKYHSRVIHWVDAISNFEVLTSLAATSFANPEMVFPELADDPYIFEAKALGHPLIPTSERVDNDFTLKGQGSIVILTGSNMSGKSTFLRTIGINTVLAFMGGPCCAKSLFIGSFNLFTSMRTSDNLEQHVSSFYAELKRLNQLITSLSHQRPTLFLLDEILKGTNSNDRHRGATALIKQLSQTSSFGLVSTHDLALGQLEGSVKGISNSSFNNRLENGKLIFSYRLTPGICDSFNASELMSQMGIAIEKRDDS